MTWITWTLWIYPLTMRPSKMTSCDVNLKSLLVYLDHKCNALRLYNKTGLKSTEPPWHVGPLLIGHQRLAPMAVVAVPLAPDQYLQAKQDRSRTEKYQNIWKIIEKYALRTIARRITMITTNPKEVTCYFRLREHLVLKLTYEYRATPAFPNSIGSMILMFFHLSKWMFTVKKVDEWTKARMTCDDPVARLPSS